VTPVDLYAFGGPGGPRPPRLNIDLIPDSSGMIGPESPPRPLNGASAYADASKAPLRGRYYLLPRGTPLPGELAVVADGKDVFASSPHPETHYTIYPTVRMSPSDFTRLFVNLPWQGPVGKKR
jgi:hypothetical protein